jgi:hypothetical protein
LEHADIAASLGSEAIAGIGGGLVKAGGYLNNALGLSDGDPRPAAAKLEEFLTYHPKTDRGKAVIGDIHKGLQAFEDWTERQGQEQTDLMLRAGTGAADVAKRLGAPPAVVDFIRDHKDAVAAAYGATTKTLLNAVPAVLSKEVGLPKGARVAGDEGAAIPRPAPAPISPAAPPPVAPAAPELSLAPSAPRQAPTAPGAPAAVPGAPLTTAPAAPRGTPSTLGEGALPAPAPPVTPKARAEAYVRDRLGLEWNAVGAATQAKLTRIAADARALDKLNPDAVRRQAHLEREGFGRKPIQTTAGKLNRDNAELLREQGAAATPSGRSIVETDVQANRDLRGNIETLVDRLRGIGTTRSKATSREQVGAAVSGDEGALTLKQKKAQAHTDALYVKARKAEPEATTAAAPIQELAQQNPAIQHLAWVPAWFKKAAAAEKVDNLEQVKLKDLSDLRQQAVGIAKAGGTEGHYAGQVIEAIDKAMEGAPEVAKAWKEAINAHKTERAEFANQGAIARLVDTKGGAYGTDPKTALEDVWKTAFKNAKLEEVRQLKRSLLSGDAESRLAGKKALRTLRAETGQDLLREITKGVSTNVKGETNITAESINRWVKGMGGGTLEGGVEKLNVLIGKRATNELMKIREDAQITKTEPTVRNVGSNTFQKILNWMDESGLGKLVKNVGGGPLAHLGDVALKSFQNSSAVRAAGETATSAAERSTAAAATKRATQIQREQTARRPIRPPPPTYGDQN